MPNRCEISLQNAPRYGINREMMDDEQEAALVRPCDPGGTQDTPCRRVEAGSRILAGSTQDGSPSVARCIDDLHPREAVRRGHRAPRPDEQAASRVQGEPQDVMPV